MLIDRERKHANSESAFSPYDAASSLAAADNSANRSANHETEVGSPITRLWWTALDGVGHSLPALLASLKRSSRVDHIVQHVKRDLLGARVALTPEEGEGYLEFTRIRNDIQIVASNLVYKNPRFDLVPGDGLIQFHFIISGDLTLAVSQTESLRLNRPSLLLWAQSQGIQVPEWIPASAHERKVVIGVRPGFLVDHLLTSIDDMPSSLQPFITNPRGKLNYCQFNLTAHMLELAAKLFANPFDGPLALVHTEAVTLELLCAAVGNFSASPAPNREHTERELRCLQAARNSLTRQLASAPTIRQLAKSVGMAETALTTGFKALYGETIFEFSLRCRMQHALSLLRDEHWSVDKVSDAVGYSHSTSFATAFRRHFGMRPIDARGVQTQSDVRWKRRSDDSAVRWTVRDAEYIADAV
jgi:AraC-like DNA-binding protein